MFRSPVLPRATAAASCTAASPDATSAMCFATSGDGAGAAPRATAGARSPDSSARTTMTGFTASEASGFLLVRPLMIDPVTALVRARVLAPGLGLDQTLRPGDDLELAVLEDLADEHGLVRVLVVLVHLDLAA